MSHSEFLMRVFRNKVFKTLLFKEAKQNTDKAHQIAKTIAKELLDPKIIYIMNPRDLVKLFLIANTFTKILHAKLQIFYEHKVTYRANFIELLRHWLDVDEFIDNLYDPDFIRRTSANDIIVSQVLAEDHIPFLYKWLADRGPYNNNDIMIRHLKRHLNTINKSIRKYWIFALAFDKQTARDAVATLTTLTFHKSYFLFKKYLTDFEKEIVLRNDWIAV
ncbi:24114_t:CDS:2 [Racocetra persica]|uniref:24114_t:CDS:1 n=1 Tax=Racocetra persica TaxID=160502 RepID=A0ACA9L503_9GLOM|nr:24114_t:CDS:2 [Racocetra persica]